MARGNANHGGTGVTTAALDKQMAGYDELPPSVRAALQDACFDWPAYPIRRWWEKGIFKSAKALCKKIADWDKSEIKRSGRSHTPHRG